MIRASEIFRLFKVVPTLKKYIKKFIPTVDHTVLAFILAHAFKFHSFYYYFYFAQAL